jgi:hypothetical protein
MVGLIVIIESVRSIIRPFTLAIRLAANIIAVCLKGVSNLCLIRLLGAYKNQIPQMNLNPRTKSGEKEREKKTSMRREEKK